MRVIKSVLIAMGAGTKQRILKSMFNNQISVDHIEVASDSDAALKEWQTRRYDVILVDSGILPMSGVELFKHMITNKFIEAERFLLVADDNSRESVRAATSAGARSYIFYPFTADRLEEVMNRMDEMLDRAGI